MSTRLFTSFAKDTQVRVRKMTNRIDRRQLRKIITFTAVLITMPLIASAASPVGTPQKADPLSTQQSQKLSENLAQFSITTEPSQPEIKMELPPPPPPPAPPTPAPAPIAPKPTRIKVAKATSSAVAGSSWLQCVPFARELSGVAVYGYAGNIRPNSSTPQVGAVALFAGVGHAAVVEAVNGDSITIKEANWVPGKITERTVSTSAIRGYVI